MRAHMSDGHLYSGSKVMKWQYKGYFLVDVASPQVFRKLHEAENYCQRNELNPDEFIKSGDLETLQRVHEIARWKYASLNEEAERLHQMLEKARAETDRLVAVRDQHEKENKRNFDRELDQEYVVKSISKAEGIYEAWKDVHERAFDYQMLLYIKKP